MMVPLIGTMMYPDVMRPPADYFWFPGGSALTLASIPLAGPGVDYFILGCSIEDDVSAIYAVANVTSQEELRRRHRHGELELVVRLEPGDRYRFEFPNHKPGDGQLLLRHWTCEQERFRCPMCARTYPHLGVLQHMFGSHSTIERSMIPGENVALLGSAARILRPYLADPACDRMIKGYLTHQLNVLAKAFLRPNLP